jgi:antitoxin ParD1/3/4
MASSVNLGPKLEATVDNLVKNGRYGSRSEVLREGVRLVEEREKALARFDAEIGKGLDSIRDGKGIPVDDAFDRIDAYIDLALARRAA